MFIACHLLEKEKKQKTRLRVKIIVSHKKIIVLKRRFKLLPQKKSTLYIAAN
jgi:hypothetical protein